MTKNEISSRRSVWDSLALPIVLMLTGLVLMAGDRLGVLSLDRIQNLWPAAVILVGLMELIPSEDRNS